MPFLASPSCGAPPPAGNTPIPPQGGGGASLHRKQVGARGRNTGLARKALRGLTKGTEGRSLHFLEEAPLFNILIIRFVCRMVWKCISAM